FIPPTNRVAPTRRCRSILLAPGGHVSALASSASARRQIRAWPRRDARPYRANCRSGLAPRLPDSSAKRLRIRRAPLAAGRSPRAREHTKGGLLPIDNPANELGAHPEWPRLLARGPGQIRLALFRERRSDRRRAADRECGRNGV